MQMNDRVAVIGAGLAGCEAAYQLAQRGHRVLLYEMKPNKRTPAHKRDTFSELVCSNSFRASRVENAVGLLKEEMRLFHSLIMSCADQTRVPAGGALAVDRELFSKLVTTRIEEHSNIEVVHEEVKELPQMPTIVATGPLSSEAMCDVIFNLFGGALHFFDAAAPIVSAESIEMSKVYAASRYGKGDDDYLNCPMSREQYEAFWLALTQAETVELKEFEDAGVFEGCMPIEVMAKRGPRTLAFGPMKPVGLEHEGVRPYAVVQLRKEDEAASAYNLVGFQTNLKFGEQKKVFSMISGLENAEFLRLGVMHRNTFINSPNKLDYNYRCKIAGRTEPLYFAGQITGVEGYVESAASGLLSGIALSRELEGKETLDFTSRTAIGALGHYVAEYNGGDFQPMNVTFGIMDGLTERIRNKKDRNTAIANRALQIVTEMEILSK